MDNITVLDQCRSFLSSMSEIMVPENMACQIFARTPLTESLCSLSDRVAHADIKTAHSTLTLGSGKTAHFDIRGMHAYGTLAMQEEKNYGAIAIIVLTIVLALAAIVLFRSR